MARLRARSYLLPSPRCGEVQESLRRTGDDCVRFGIPKSILDRRRYRGGATRATDTVKARRTPRRELGQECLLVKVKAVLRRMSAFNELTVHRVARGRRRGLSPGA